MSENDAGPDIGYLLNKATRQFRLRFADALAEMHVTPQQAAVLLAIAASVDGRLRPGAIAESIDTDRATTSGLLNRLIRDGWLYTEPDPDDGRSRFMGLTDKAEAALPGVMSAAQAVSVEATSCLSPAEVGTLARLLSRLCDQAEAVTGKRIGGDR